MNKNNMITPSGVEFRFTVTPSVTPYHQQGLRYYITNESGLSQYFKAVSVSFFDGCYVDKDGLSVTDDNLKGKQMQVKVFCPEPTIAIDKSKEEDFYNQIKEKFSDWIVELIQSNTETEYKAKICAFLFVHEMKKKITSSKR